MRRLSLVGEHDGAIDRFNGPPDEPGQLARRSRALLFYRHSTSMAPEVVTPRHGAPRKACRHGRHWPQSAALRDKRAREAPPI